MHFHGYPGIKPDKFEEILLAGFNPETKEWEPKLFEELKKQIQSGAFQKFTEKEGYEPSPDIKPIIDAAVKSVETGGGIVGVIKMEKCCGDWFIRLRTDGSIETNILLDKNEWSGLADVWVGLNSAVGMKTDGTLMQVGSDPDLCLHKGVKEVVTRTYLNNRKWAIRTNDDRWIYFDGKKKRDVKGAKLDESGELVITGARAERQGGLDG